MRSLPVCFAVGLGLGLVPAGTARADVTVDVELNARGMELARARGMTPAELAARIRSRVNELYRTAQVGDYLSEFTNATAFSARGLGVDYASLPESLIFGFAGTATVTSGDATIAGEDVLGRGLAANFAAMAGMNLAAWHHPRWTVFANGFYRDASTDDLSGAITSGGAHIQIKAIEPQMTSATLRWIGLEVTTGLELTHWSFGSTAPMSNSVTVDAATQASLATMGRLDLRSTTATVPIELSTGIRIARFAAVYVGGALDLSAGDSTVTANLSGDIRTSDGQPLGALRISGSEDHTDTFVDVRALAGAQLELSKFQLFVQLNAAPSVASLGAGFRVVL
jgi:hypothetical protein